MHISFGGFSRLPLSYFCSFFFFFFLFFDFFFLFFFFFFKTEAAKLAEVFVSRVCVTSTTHFDKRKTPLSTCRYFLR
jgi:hypothetical protein